MRQRYGSVTAPQGDEARRERCRPRAAAPACPTSSTRVPLVNFLAAASACLGVRGSASVASYTCTWFTQCNPCKSKPCPIERSVWVHRGAGARDPWIGSERMPAGAPAARRA